MTTIDVRITRLGGRGSLDLSSGLFGSATTVLHAVVEACRRGEVTGQCDETYVDLTLIGAQLVPILRSLTGSGYPSSASRSEIDAYCDEIDPAEEIHVFAVEF